MLCGAEWVLCDLMSTLSYFLTAITHVFIFRHNHKGHGQVKAALLKVRCNQVKNETKSCLFPVIIHDKINLHSSLL